MDLSERIRQTAEGNSAVRTFIICTLFFVTINVRSMRVAVHVARMNAMIN